MVLEQPPTLIDAALLDRTGEPTELWWICVRAGYRDDSVLSGRPQ